MIDSTGERERALDVPLASYIFQNLRSKSPPADLIAVEISVLAKLSLSLETLKIVYLFGTYMSSLVLVAIRRFNPRSNSVSPDTLRSCLRATIPALSVACLTQAQASQKGTVMKSANRKVKAPPGRTARAKHPVEEAKERLSRRRCDSSPSRCDRFAFSGRAMATSWFACVWCKDFNN